MPANIILRAHNLIKSYSLENKGDTSVLKGISIDVVRGEFLALVGPSGAGKSTLLHLLGLLDEPDGGSIEYYLEETTPILSANLSVNSAAAIRNHAFGFIFQIYHLLPEFTAVENVMMPLLVAGESRKAAEPKALELLNRIGLKHRADHKPSQLSGGEQQRVGIARAIVNQPEIVFADEPTGNLDSANAQEILTLMNELQKEKGLTFVVATHSADVSAVAGRIITIRDGVVQAET